MKNEATRRAPARVVIENVAPEIDSGRFPIKRVVGERVLVSADVHCDGHDALRAVLRYRAGGEDAWRELPMRPLGNDRFEASFAVTSQSAWRYTLEAWPDAFRTWRHGAQRKREADVLEEADLLAGAELLAAASARAAGEDAQRLAAAAQACRTAEQPLAARADHALSDPLVELVERYPDRSCATAYERELLVTVDRPRGRFSAWYELFPRSCADVPGRHGTLLDCAARLPYVAEMGFDVVYLPPIHPIGRSQRKGRNNAPEAGPDDVGSPWAIGAQEGGHTSVHPLLGGQDAFRALMERARGLGLEVALDLAFQCSPDHPWVREHPDWFRQRPDGSVQYAENPPKKYEDIYPLHFECEGWQALFDALRDVVLFWVGEGVRIFRVDNPHTKPFALWEWLIAEVRREHPDVLFLAEAFTRPKVMYRLAKVGFTQSYTYFAWRNTKHELTQYMRELTRGEVSEYFRPSLWPNTPDILPEPLQFGGRAAFQSRLVLAATLGASYGIYGPAFELCEGRAKTPGSEEYLDSEKYEVRHWELGQQQSLKPLIARLNRIRRENEALHTNETLRFLEVDNEQLIAYAKTGQAGSNVIVVVVNLDPHHVHSGWLELPLEELDLDPRQPYQLHELLSGARYLWNGPRNYVEIDPGALPAQVFRVRRRLRSERDFDYFL